jgi:3-hydroxybutyryl-CoA dehydrogenase
MTSSPTRPDGLPVVAVIGAGVMGAGIAQVLSAECEVWLHDVSHDQLSDALRRIEHGRFGLLAAVDRGRTSTEAAAEALARVRPTADLAQACVEADLVVEAVPEDLGLKMTVFAELDARCPDRTVLTSNSGGLPVVALARATRRPDRVLGWHWAQPTAVMRLAELVVHPTVDTAAVAFVADLARRCGKNPITVRDQPHAWGYVANRINAAARREADRIVDEGVATPEQVDQLVKDCFRWPMGPFEMQSTTSLD